MDEIYKKNANIKSSTKNKIHFYYLSSGKSSKEFRTLEGCGRLRRHRHATVKPKRLQIPIRKGDLTKIEVELAEAPDNIQNQLPAILIGSVPSEVEATSAVNSTYIEGIAAGTGVVVRAEEVLIVVLVLMLWVAAIALFFNRWGKIRMLEPYQPKFQQQHRQSCSVVDQNAIPHATCSKMNIHSVDYQTVIPPGTTRPRQNSVFVGSSNLSLLKHGIGRRSKSAFDIQSLVTAESMIPDAMDEEEPPGLRALKAQCVLPEYPKHMHALRDHRLSIFQFDKNDLSIRQLQKERRRSICNFDRSDILAYPPPRDRGNSISHSDKYDAQIRPFLRLRDTSLGQYDRGEPSHPSLRNRGMSVCSFERADNLCRMSHRERLNTYASHHVDKYDAHKESRRSVGDVERLDSICKAIQNRSRTSIANIAEEAENGGRTAEPCSSSVDADEPPRGLHGTWRRIRRPSLTNLQKLESLGRTVQADSPPRSQSFEKSEICALFSQGEKRTSGSHLDKPSSSKTTEVVFGYKATCV